MDKIKTALIIGGGIAGIEAAIKIGEAGHRAVLLEIEDRLGGNLCKLYSSFPRWESPEELLNYKIAAVKKCSNVNIMTNTTISEVEKTDDGYRVALRGAENKAGEIIEVNAVIIATGFDLFDAAVYGEYGYGVFKNVINSLEFETTLKEWSENREQVTPPKTVAFFKCVGSRDRSKGLPYCSKICCMYTAKQAGLVKDFFPDTKCYVFYMDYRAAGKGYEEFVRSVIEEKHVRYVRGRPAKVLPENNRLVIRVEDTLMGRPVEIKADLIVLATAIVPSRGTRQMAELFKTNRDDYGFINYKTIEPMQTAEGVFFAGACGFAVETVGAMQQGAAAAADVLALFNRKN